MEVAMSATRADVIPTFEVDGVIIRPHSHHFTLAACETVLQEVRKLLPKVTIETLWLLGTGAKCAKCGAGMYRADANGYAHQHVFFVCERCTSITPGRCVG
jgi:hypothetical protein